MVTDDTTTAAASRSAKASKTLDTMRAPHRQSGRGAHRRGRTRRAPPRSPRPRPRPRPATAKRPGHGISSTTHAAEQAGECRHGAELAERTRRRWALKCDSMACSIRPGRLPPGGSGLPALRQPATLLSCHRSGRDRPRPFGRTTGPLPRFPAAGVPLLGEGTHSHSFTRREKHNAAHHSL